ncbi:MAG: hypothetical protein ACRD0U_05305, partial [Acidimicrobiales bacterium]
HDAIDTWHNLVPAAPAMSITASVGADNAAALLAVLPPPGPSVDLDPTRLLDTLTGIRVAPPGACPPMTTRQLVPDDHAVEPLDEGGTWLLDLVGAVDHLRRGIRPGITVWDALEEALRWHTSTADGDEPSEPAWDDVDPLRSTVGRFLGRAHGLTSMEAQIAVRHWVLAMAARYNDGHHWPHPTQRRSFRPPLLASELTEGTGG